MAELLQREQQYTPLWQQSGRHLNFHRWAGFSGAVAVIFTVYAEHGYHSGYDKHKLAVANQLHYIHTLALLAIPLARRPFLVGRTKKKLPNRNKSIKTDFVFFFSSRAYCF